MKCKFKHLAMLSVVLMLVASCQLKDQFDDVTMEGDAPAYVLPLIKSTLTFRELAEKDRTNTLVLNDATGEYYLSFLDTFQFNDEKVANQIMSSIENDMEFKFTGKPEYDSENNRFVWKARHTGYETKGYHLKRVYPRASQITLVVDDVDHNNRKKIHCMLDLKSLVELSGTPNYHDMPIRHNGNTESTFDVNLGSGWHDYNAYFDFDPENKNEHGWFYIYIYDLTIDNVPVTDPDVCANAVRLEATIKGTEKDSVVGKFGLTNLKLAQKVSLGVDVFKSTMEADIYIENPQFNATVKNGAVALDFWVGNVKTFRKYEETSGDTLYLANEGTLGDGGLLLGEMTAVDTTGWNEVGVGTTNFSLNGVNSNINEAFTLAPTYLEFDAILRGKKGPVSLDNLPYISVSAQTGIDVEVQTEIRLPLHGYANFLTKDGVRLPLPELPEVELNNNGMDSANVILYLHADNAMPIDVQLQAYFVKYDTVNGVEVPIICDSLLQVDKDDKEKYFIAAADADDEGRSLGKKRTQHMIKFDHERYKKIREATEVKLWAKFHTKNADPALGSASPLVRVMSKDELVVWIGAEVRPHPGRKKFQ